MENKRLTKEQVAELVDGARGTPAFYAVERLAREVLAAQAHTSRVAKMEEQVTTAERRVAMLMQGIQMAYSLTEDTRHPRDVAVRNALISAMALGTCPIPATGLREAVVYAIGCLTKVGLEPDAEGSPYARALAALQSAHDGMAPGEALPSVDALCEVIHDAYEAAAKREGWETQARSRKPWADVPEANKATMRVAVLALLRALGLTK